MKNVAKHFVKLNSYKTSLLCQLRYTKFINSPICIDISLLISPDTRHNIHQIITVLLRRRLDMGGLQGTIFSDVSRIYLWSLWRKIGFATFILGNIKTYVNQFVTLKHWDGAGSWHPFLWTIRSHLSCIVNNLATDGPVTKEARTSTATVLTPTDAIYGVV